MEFHLAVKNILKYQGADFLLDTKMVNALIDFQAYEFHPAMKNIFRTLHADGYISKIAKTGAWNTSCDQLIYEVERDYAFPHDLVDYIFKGVAFGLGFLASVSAPNTSNQNTSQQQKPKTQPTIKPWKKMSVDERETYLNSLVQIKPSHCGLKFDSVYIADNSYDENDVFFYINYELSGSLSKDTYVNLSYAIYDKSNRLRLTNILTSTLGDERSKRYDMVDSCFIGLNFKYNEIGKILIFIEE